MTTRLLFVALGLIACDKTTSSTPTAPGTTVMTWELAKADRVAIRTAKLGEVKSTTHEHVAKVGDQTIAKLKVHVDTAAVEFDEDGKKVSQTAPVKLRIEAVESNGFTLTPKDCKGPQYWDNVTEASPQVLRCSLNAKKPKHDLGFMIYVYGDGHIEDGIRK